MFDKIIVFKFPRKNDDNVVTKKPVPESRKDGIFYLNVAKHFLHIVTLFVAQLHKCSREFFFQVLI